jgi:polyhydroxyalkanoate synthase
VVRRGPRPLALHLASAGLAWSSLRLMLPALLGGQAPLPHPLAAESARLRANLLAADPTLEGAASTRRLAEAVDRAGERRMLDFTAGVRAYRGHPYRRRLADPPAIWRQGTTRLLDYGTAGKAKRGAILVVPSLVNRATVLDLTETTSLMRHLARQGYRPFLVDWDAPGPEEKAFGLDEYIAGRLEAALDAAVAAYGGPVALLGYCMGGNLALALALRRPQDVAGLACLATPWDFQADGPISAPLEPAMASSLAEAIAALPEFPVDLLQAMFASLDPFLVNRKYRAFAERRAAGGEDELFVAIEDWVNDGVPLAAKVASQCLLGWYGANEPAQGRWHVAGEAVAPGRLRCPALVIIPARDRIVPPASAHALAAAIPQAQTLTVPSGHVAMVVGEHGPRLTWQPLVAWLASLPFGVPVKPTRAAAARQSRAATKQSHSRAKQRTA